MNLVRNGATSIVIQKYFLPNFRVTYVCFLVPRIDNVPAIRDQTRSGANTHQSILAG